MDLMLIECVRTNPVLYDPTNRDYHNHQSRKEAWEEIGETLGISGNECKENWNKLRNAYMQAKNRRTTKPGQAAKSLSKWKFEDEMAFLNPSLVARKCRGNVEDSPNNEDEDEMREEISVCPIEEIDAQVVSSESSQSYTPKNGLVQSATPKIAEVIGNSSANVSVSPIIFDQPSVKPVSPCVGNKRLLSSMEEMVTVMKDSQRLRAQALLQSERPMSSINMDDECELLFLSMAKHVKKLRPDEQIRVKMEVSNIVLGAALKAARESSFSENP